LKYKLYHGKSPYLSLEAVHEYIQKEREKDPSRVYQLLEVDTLKPKEILDQLSSPSLFSEKRILFLKRIYKNKERKILLEEILTLLEGNNTDDIIIIWEDQKIKSNTKYYKFFKEAKAIEEFDQLNKRTFFTWLRKEVEKNDLKIDQSVTKELAERTNYDPERCANEIRKFKLSNNGKIIEKKDIEEFTSDTLQEDIWGLIDAINQEDNITSMQILERLSTQFVDVNYIISMLVRNLRLITLTKYLSEQGKDYREISSILKIPPFTTPSLVRSSSKYTEEKLKKLYTKLSSLDHKIKTGQIDGRLGLTLICPYL
jgi:DNA polymerase III delta subunit